MTPFSILISLLLLGIVLSFTPIANGSLKYPLPRVIHRHGPRTLLTQRNQSLNDEEDGQDFSEKTSIEMANRRGSKTDLDINTLVKQKDQRETMINRLKFQLNEFKATVAESERRQMEAEEKVAKIKSETEDAIGSEERAIETIKAEYR
jgi:hypothetical protein